MHGISASTEGFCFPIMRLVPFFVQRYPCEIAERLKAEPTDKRRPKKRARLDEADDQEYLLGIDNPCYVKIENLVELTPHVRVHAEAVKSILLYGRE